jgi:hypothetical protein
MSGEHDGGGPDLEAQRREHRRFGGWFLSALFVGLFAILAGIARDCLARGAVGDPCVEDRDCRTRLCARRRADPAGVCSRRCSSADPCPDDMRCRSLDRCVPRAWDEPDGR